MKTTLVIFGITGDLAQRKLLPALANIIEAGQTDDFAIVGVSRRPVEEFEVLGDHHPRLSGTTSMFQMDLGQTDDYKKLGEYICKDNCEQIIFYLSVPPDSVSQIVENLGVAGLNTPNCKLLLEKPFGKDLASAGEMIDHTAKYFDDEQVYRIDHYLAKEMAQNIVTFRAKNAIFQHIWNNQFIKKIEVVALESIDIESRAVFYEQTGALRDLVQGHLMQLLALTLLETPADLDWDKLPDLRLEALRRVQLTDPTQSLRSQYEGYRNEVGNNDSQVETFMSVALESTDPRWDGVSLALTTGKALSQKKTEVRVHFRRTNDSQSNYLIFKIQPDEGIAIDLVTKKPGYEREVEHQKLSYMYPADVHTTEAYEQVLVDAINSRKSLFACSSEVLRSWEILAPIQESWKTASTIHMYPKGSKASDVIRSIE